MQHYKILKFSYYDRDLRINEIDLGSSWTIKILK